MRYGFDLSDHPVVLFTTIPLLILGCYLVRRMWRTYLYRRRHFRRHQHRG